MSALPRSQQLATCGHGATLGFQSALAGRCPSLRRSVRTWSPLDGLPTGPTDKLAAGGYVLAALTRGRDLFCWGGYPGRRPVVLKDLTGKPSPIVVSVTAENGDNEGADIVDVGVGDGHMIVLTANGSVAVIGSNANGQLGLVREDEAHRGSHVLTGLGQSQRASAKQGPIGHPRLCWAEELVCRGSRK